MTFAIAIVIALRIAFVVSVVSITGSKSKMDDEEEVIDSSSEDEVKMPNVEG